MATHTAETHSFGAEVGKILHLMIHSLYAHKEIFLRELISNASDACDKLRYQAVMDPNLLESDSELTIHLTANDKEKTLVLRDNGIGMNREELIQNLGTIARSGTQNFLESLSGDSKKDVQLIGQFGVGFYSSFMVADSVRVVSRKAGESQAWRWSSKGDGSFEVEAVAEECPRGTEITLHLKEECAEEFTDKHRIRHVVETYSDHISFPVSFTDIEGKTERLNKGAALWTRPKSEIEPEQYQEFYRHVAHAVDDPWLTIHNKAEGTLEYTSLLFIPSTPPFDLFHPDRKTRIRLYVKRVFITEENVELLPNYLRFVRGVVDSEDLPLNISRETLQHNALIARIRQALVKRILSDLKKKAEEAPADYQAFWNHFGAAVKEGLCEGVDATREPLLEVCRFASTDQEGVLTSLDGVVARMKESQEAIYYLTADSLEKALLSPQLEGFKKRGIEVLLLTDTVDDFWVNVVHEYKGKPLHSITRAGINLESIPLKEGEVESEAPSESALDKADAEALCALFKAQLGERVRDVRISQKLAASPVCLVASEGAMDIRLERFLRDQKQLKHTMPKTLELNPSHPVIRHIQKHPKASNVSEHVELLFDYAHIIEGEPLHNSAAFAERMNHLWQSALVA